jgi:XTP/dITP diphosphohydrolase
VKVLLATRNPGKQAEMRALFAGSPIELSTREDLPEVEESGNTYAENATFKARAAAAFRGSWALADDTGLEVEALGGAPGVRSARYAPTDEERRARLLRELRGRPPAYRKARFVCVMALASPDGVVHLAEGECAGRIAASEKGGGGFGYDPVFWLPDLGRTYAELSEEEKNQISHRARAAEKMIRIARGLFG